MKKYSVAMAFLLIAVFVFSQGCYTLNQVGSATDTGIELTNKDSATAMSEFSAKKKVNHFLWGLVSPADAEVEQLIANQVKSSGGSRAVNVRMKYQLTFIDGLISGITFGIYTPFTLTVQGDVAK